MKKKQTNISLQSKILANYVIMIVLIGSMTAIFLHERKKISTIKSESVEILRLQRDINTVHCHITMLATRGESAIAWDVEDRLQYHKYRLQVDSLLVLLKESCTETFVRPDQIDTLRQLLANKEEHLLGIIQASRLQDEADSLLQNRLPAVTRQVTQSRTVTRKKKGIAGLFGKEETVILPVSDRKLRSLNEQLIAIQKERRETIENYTDSLRMHNKELNKKLYTLVNSLNSQAQKALKERELRLKSSYEHSSKIITGLTLTAFLLLFSSYIRIYRDIRKKAKGKKELEESVKNLRQAMKKNEELLVARHQIIQTVTHELRTPLTTIKGNAELLRDEKEADGRLHHIEIISQSVGRMTTLINTLLDYFRLDNGKETVTTAPFRLASIPETLKYEFIPQAENKHLQLVIIGEGENEVVNGDKNRILSIGGNLLSNAIKFTKSGIVILTVRYKDNLLTIIVEDTGTGIDKEKLEKIFLPFERLGNAATQDGFGLGLPIVKSLVDLLGGNLSVESEPGKGSRFTVTLPMEKTEFHTPEDKSDTGFPIFSGCSVVAIDNDEVTLGMMREMFARGGVDCDTCLNAGELTDKIRCKDYDLLITDLKMPEMDGYDILELLRTSDIGNSRTIPVVATTAAGDISEEELKVSGFAALLGKPFSLDELLAVTESCIVKKHERHIDFSSLLAFGDKQQTLERLITETEKEMDEVHAAIGHMDLEKLDSWIHHLRSSWMLMKAEEPLQALYGLIHDTKSHTSEELAKAANAILAQGDAIIRLAKKEQEGIWEE